MQSKDIVCGEAYFLDYVQRRVEVLDKGHDMDGRRTGVRVRYLDEKTHGWDRKPQAKGSVQLVPARAVLCTWSDHERNDRIRKVEAAQHRDALKVLGEASDALLNELVARGIEVELSGPRARASVSGHRQQYMSMELDLRTIEHLTAVLKAAPAGAVAGGGALADLLG